MDSTAHTRAVFVVGSPRSGTSALAWAIGQHPEMATGPEADFPFYVAKLFETHEAPALHPPRDLAPLETAWQVSRQREDGWVNENDVSRDEFMAAIGSGLDRLMSSRYGGKRWVDSTPVAAIVLPQLAKLFPEALFIHILRDGRAAVSSMERSGFDVRVAKDFRFACETWEHCVRKAHAFSLERPDRCLEIRQELLASDPEAAMAEVMPFLGLDECPAAVAYLKAGRINSSWGNKSPGDVRKTKPHDVVPEAPWGDWTPDQKETFESVAAETMELVGYDCTLD